MAATTGPSLTARIALEGADQVKKQLDDIGKSGANAAATISNATNEANGRLARIGEMVNRARDSFHAFHASVEPMRESFRRVHEDARRFGEQLEKMGNTIFPNFKEVLTLGLAAGVAGFAAFIKEAAFATHELENFANTVGITKNAVLGFDLVGARAGISTDRMRVALANFAKTASEERIKLQNLTQQAAAGDAKAVEEINRVNNAVTSNVAVFHGALRPLLDTASGYRLLGIDVRNFNDDEESNTKLLLTVINRLNDHNYAMQRAQASQMIFQRGWRELAPVIKSGSDELQDSIKQILAWQVQLDETEEHQSHTFLKAFETLNIVFTRFRTIIGNIIGQGLIPVLDALREKIVGNLPAWREWAERVSEAVRMVAEDVASLIRFGQGAELKTDIGRNLLAAFTNIRQAAILTYEVLRTVFNGVSQALQPVASLINRVFGTEFTGQSLLITGVVLRLIGFFGLLNSGIRLVLSSVRFLGTAFQALAGSARFLLAFLGWPGLIAAGLLTVVTAIASTQTEFENLRRAFQAGFRWLRDVLFAFASWLTGEGVDSWETFGKAAVNWLSKIVDLAIVAGRVIGALGERLLEMQDAFLKAHGVPEGLKRYIPGYGEPTRPTAPEERRKAAEPGVVLHPTRPGEQRPAAEVTAEGVTVFRGGALGVEAGLVGAVAREHAVKTPEYDEFGRLMPRTKEPAPVPVTIKNPEVPVKVTNPGAIGRYRPPAEDITAGAGGAKAITIGPNGEQTITRGTDAYGVLGAALPRAQAPITGLPGVEAAPSIMPPEARPGERLYDIPWEEIDQSSKKLDSAVDKSADSVSTFDKAVNAVASAVGTAIDTISEALKRVGESAAAPIPYAFGGTVPGFGTSDSVHALLTPGEFVVNRFASRTFGPLLAAMNSFGRIPSGITDGIGPPRFAEGGMVMAGATAGGTPVHLHLGGHEFAMSASPSVARALVAEAGREQMRSAGVKPSWYAGTPGGR